MHVNATAAHQLECMHGHFGTGGFWQIPGSAAFECLSHHIWLIVLVRVFCRWPTKGDDKSEAEVACDIFAERYAPRLQSSVPVETEQRSVNSIENVLNLAKELNPTLK